MLEIQDIGECQTDIAPWSSSRLPARFITQHIEVAGGFDVVAASLSVSISLCCHGSNGHIHMKKAIAYSETTCYGT